MPTLSNTRSYLRLTGVLLPWLVIPLCWAGQIDSASYFHLRRGMNESEILLRAGEPDRITGLNTAPLSANQAGYAAADLEIKRFHYIPGALESDPHLTVITFRGGLVSRIERSKVFSRVKPPETDAVRRPLTTDEVRRKQADRVLDAARDYAEIRQRLKRQGGTGTTAAENRAPPEAGNQDK